MLVLSRKQGQDVIVAGVRIRVEDIRGGRVRLSFDAPPEVRILRGELEAHETEASDDA